MKTFEEFLRDVGEKKLTTRIFVDPDTDCKVRIVLGSKRHRIAAIVAVRDNVVGIQACTATEKSRKRRSR